MNVKCTKAQVKKRLIIFLILGLLLAIGMAFFPDNGDMPAIVWILAPLLLTWSLFAISLDFINYLKLIFGYIPKVFVYAFSLHFGQMIVALFKPFIEYFKMLVNAIKVIFWAFSSGE